jgi:RNA polymerase sigma-70 factor (ECF subfamily)
MEDIKNLVKNAKGGDKEALLQLIMEQKNDYYRLAYVYMNNKEDALDALEDMIVKVYEKIKSLKDEEAFYSWSKTILVNCCKLMLKKRRKIVLFNKPEEKPYTEKYEEKEQNHDLQKYMAKLNKDQQEAIKLKYYFDLDYMTISEMLKVPVGTVKSRISTGLHRLQEIMGGAYNG